MEGRTGGKASKQALIGIGLALIATLVAVFYLQRDASSERPSREVIMRTTQIEPRYALPFLLRPIDSPLGDAIFEPMLLMTPSFELRPNLVESWRLIDGGRRILLRLRPDVLFHNGRRLTARDVEFSLIRGMLGQTGRFNATVTKFISGSAALKDTTKYEPGMCEGIKVIDEVTLELQFDSPSPAFLFHLTHPITSPVPREELAADLKSWRHLPVGTGPFEVKSHSRDGARWDLRRFSKYFRSDASGPNAVILSSKPADTRTATLFSDHTPPVPAAKAAFQRVESAEGTPLVVMFLLPDANAAASFAPRQVVLASIPQLAARRVLEPSGFIPLDSFLPPKFWPRWSAPQASTPDAAVDSKIVGWTFKLIVRKSVPEDHPSRAVTALLRAALIERIPGGHVDVVDVDDPFVLSAEPRTLNVFVAMPTFPFCDPDSLRSYFGQGSPFYGSGNAESEDVRQLWETLELARVSTDRTKRANLYQKAMSEIASSALGAPIAFRSTGIWVDPTQVDPRTVFATSSRLRFEEISQP